LLREEPRRPTDLAKELGVSLSTAKRILAAIRDAGEPLTTEKRGREAFYRLKAYKET
jgi:predicted DNA-binding transcriptional regulator YafY